MTQLTPPPRLYVEILDQIRYQQKLAQLKQKIVIWASGLIGSWLAFLILLQNFSRQAGQSGFSELSRLMLSDFGVVKTYFYDYALSLIESLPIISLSLIALSLLVTIGTALKFLTSAVELKRLKIH